MASMKLDSKTVPLEHGQSILELAAAAGIKIPTLCHHPDLPTANSCMVCLVRDVASGQFIPACSYPAASGMEIDASSPEVLQARKDALELLLREHRGDCEAPCRRGCPAGMDISAMMRAVAAGDWLEAGRVVRSHIPLPRILGSICPAPCEKLCRRAELDHALSICRMKYVIGEMNPVVTNAVPCSHAQSRVAVVGAGPAGVSVAWQFRLLGYACDLYDRTETPWTALAKKVGADRLSASVAEADYRIVGAAGIRLVPSFELVDKNQLRELTDEYASVVLAGGEDMADRLGDLGVQILPDAHTTSTEGVFVCGAARRRCRMAARAVGDGRKAAEAACSYMAGGEAIPQPPAFDSHAGKLTPEQLAELAENCASYDARRWSETDARDGAGNVPAILRGADLALPSPGMAGRQGVSPPAREPDTAERSSSAENALAHESIVEAQRCMSCDCRAKESCDLRRYATEYGIGRVTAHPPEYGRMIIREHPELVYEPGKCIRCGLCVRMAEKLEEPLGLALTGRGRQTRLQVPLGRTWPEALTHAAQACIDICPTGALVGAKPLDIP